jgi:hypothetical protein
MIASSEVATRDSKLLGLGTVFYSPGKKNLARKSSEVSCSQLITENKAYLTESDVTVCDTIKYSPMLWGPIIFLIVLTGCLRFHIVIVEQPIPLRP